MESETGQIKDTAFLMLQRKMELQATLLSHIRLENSDLRKQLETVEGKHDVVAQTARDFQTQNTHLKQRLDEAKAHDRRVKQQLQEVEAHLAMVLDARDLEKDSHNAEVELLQQELTRTNNDLIKQEKLQKKISQPSCKEASTGTEGTIWADSYAQTDGDAALHPLRRAAEKLHQDVHEAVNAFRAAVKRGSERWDNIE